MISSRTSSHSHAANAAGSAEHATPSGCGCELTGGHFVQFYEEDEELLKLLKEFVWEGLQANESAVIIATPDHRRGLEDLLRAAGADLDRLKEQDAFQVFDAAETLSRFMTGDRPADRLFVETIEPVLARAGAGGRPVRAFGEMVALLYSEEKSAAAIRLEELWNDLGRRHDFSLFCAYPIKSFSGADHEEALRKICCAHSRILSPEKFSGSAPETERALAITLLQQKAVSLEAETAERRFAEKSLRDKQEAMTELEAFAYSISHDLRAPLRSMRNYAELLIEEHSRHVPAEALDYLRRIAAAGERMDHVIRDVLSYNRMARPEFEVEPINLTHIIEGVLECCPNLQPPNATIAVQRPLPVVLGKPAALTQCFTNLLGNAVKFVAPQVHPVIEISAQPLETAAEKGGAGESSASWVRISIQDNGIGIPKEAHEKIFELFQRAQTNYEGTGIGLATVKKAAARMGGRISCSSNPAGGSIFMLDLRLATR